MASGGRRPGAGRPKKAATQKILEGNPGRRAIEIVDFGQDAMELPSEPPAYLSAKAKEIYKTVYAWLKGIGCTKGILPYNLEEYAFCKAHEYQARTTCEGPGKRKGDAVPVRGDGAAIPKTDQRCVGENISRGTREQAVEMG